MADSTSAPPTPTPVAHDPVAQTIALLQPWIEYVPQQQRRLGLFICLALALHIAAFFFILIDTSRAELRREPRIHVSLELPQSVAAADPAALHFWDRLTDPRDYLQPQNPMTDPASETPPVPLNAAIGSGLAPEPAAPDAYRAVQPAAEPLDQRVTEAMTPARQPFTYSELPRPIATRTTWTWDDNLNERAPAGVPDLPSPTTDTDLSATKLRVAVNERGTVEHVLVEQSCGDQGATIGKELDQEAATAARKIRFTPAGQPGLQWGLITVFWRYSAKPREEVVPTPPTPQ